MRLDLFQRYQAGILSHLLDLKRQDILGDPTVVRYDREPLDDNSLWLWIMPLPPAGPVVIEASWPHQSIVRSSFAFEGGLLALG
jgi:hypothetical protein